MPRIRIALAQVNATVGDLAGNCEQVLAWTGRAAERHTSIVVFPELMITGYLVEDLALRASVVDASIAAAARRSDRRIRASRRSQPAYSISR